MLKRRERERRRACHIEKTMVLLEYLDHLRGMDDPLFSV